MCAFFCKSYEGLDGCVSILALIPHAARAQKAHLLRFWLRDLQLFQHRLFQVQPAFTELPISWLRAWGLFLDSSLPLVCVSVAEIAV